MPLIATCPRCSAPVSQTEAGWVCVEHGEITLAHRPEEASYADFADHLRLAGQFPTYLPWPLGPGWTITDFAVVGGETERARGTMTCCSGLSTLDGPVDVVVVTEEPGTGLGARIAQLPTSDPGSRLGDGKPEVQLRIGSQNVLLWPVSVSDSAGDLDRSVMVGEADGRWLWMILRPASAVLLLRDDWILRDVATVGPVLVELPFGGRGPTW